MVVEKPQHSELVTVRWDISARGILDPQLVEDDNGNAVTVH